MKNKILAVLVIGASLITISGCANTADGFGELIIGFGQDWRDAASK